jgi:uncharacterized membrane protein YfcA
VNWRAVLTSPLGFLIGLSLGALGGGGSILAVPALVYGAGQTAQAATTTSLVLVGVTSLIGIIPHWRAGGVRLVPGIIFGLAGIGGSLLGSSWNSVVDPDVLLLAFSGLMLVAAAGMWRRCCTGDVPTTRGPRPTWAPDDEVPATSDAGSPCPAGETITRTTLRLTPSVVLKVAVAGTVVGLLTGFFGVGGGFIIVPALVLALGFSMPEAIGTSLVVIAINSATALASRLDGGTLDWGVIVPFMIASLLGLRTGTRMATTKDPAVLQRWFVYLLVVVALYTATRSVLALV